MKKLTKQITIFTTLILITLATLYISNFSSPEQIIQKIGIQNTYIILFIVSFFAGFSSGGSLIFLAGLTAFLSGGLKFLTVALISGTALAIGDIIMLHLFLSGRKLIPKKTQHKLDKLSNYLNKKPTHLIPIIIIIYIVFSPLPNDILILSLAAINYTKRKAIPLIIIGDITFTILYSYLISQGITLFL
jgi:hypothetical protein